jgi:predicted NodU family carbamoyl transferase
MNILGISAFYHDSAAAIVVDGEIMAAAQEERFTRKKHDSYRKPLIMNNSKIINKGLNYRYTI